MTALAPAVGYDAAAALVHDAAAAGRDLADLARERGLPDDVVALVDDLASMAGVSRVDPPGTSPA